MRRVVAIALMLVFTSPLLLPLFASNPISDASLPACCRGHGKHRCVMLKRMAMLDESSGPAITAPPCPLYPTASAAVRLAPVYFVVPRLPSAQIRRDPALSAPIPLRARLFAPASQSTRGPPACFA